MNAKSVPATISHKSAHSAKDRTSEIVAGCDISLIVVNKKLNYHRSHTGSLDCAAAVPGTGDSDAIEYDADSKVHQSSVRNVKYTQCYRHFLPIVEFASIAGNSGKQHFKFTHQEVGIVEYVGKAPCFEARMKARYPLKRCIIFILIFLVHADAPLLLPRSRTSS